MFHLLYLLMQTFRLCVGQRRWVSGNIILLAAIVELLWFTLVMCWVVTAIWNIDSIMNSPIIDEVGYVNACVGWDSAPAYYISLPMFVVISSMVIRYVIVDAHMTALQNKRAFVLKIVLNSMLVISILTASLIFVVLPTSCPDCVRAHTAFYIQLIIAIWLQLLGVYTSTLAKSYQYCFFGVYSAITFGNVSCLIANAGAFVPGQTKPFVPAIVGGIFDWGWFVSFTIVPMFLPFQDNSIEYNAELVDEPQGCGSCACIVYRNDDVL